MLKKIFSDYRYATWLWFLAALAAVIQFIFIRSDYNNFRIFRGVFWHTLEQLPLFAEYPAEYGDANHYGVFFSAVIAPFAVMPVWLGCSLWVMANAWLLYYAVKNLPLNKKEIIIILLISVHEMYTASAMQQFNPSIVALLIGTYILIKKEKDHWATLLIVIGLLTKIYGIAGLAFFFFSKHKIRFILSGLFWLAVGLVLPMLYSSPEYVLSQYQDWAESISQKNGKNLTAVLQNLSLIGFLKKTGLYGGSDMYLIISGIIIFLLPYLRFSQYKYEAFRLQFLASVCLFLVLFSSGSENSTYIIAYIGIGIWFVLSPNRNKILKIILLALAILASLSPTDLVPKSIKWEYVIKYSLRAVPPAIIWFTMIYEMCTMDYSESEKKIKEKVINKNYLTKSER